MIDGISTLVPSFLSDGIRARYLVPTFLLTSAHHPPALPQSSPKAQLCQPAAFVTIGAFVTFYWCLIPVVVITSLASYLLLEERRQLICLKLGLGPICCDENYQFHWACDREYSAVINFYLKSSNKQDILHKTNVDGQNVFEFSYERKKYRSMKALIQHPDEVFDAMEVRKFFWKACYKGDTKVVQLFAK